MNHAPMQIWRKTKKGAAIFRRAFLLSAHEFAAKKNRRLAPMTKSFCVASAQADGFSWARIHATAKCNASHVKNLSQKSVSLSLRVNSRLGSASQRRVGLRPRQIIFVLRRQRRTPAVRQHSREFTRRTFQTASKTFFAITICAAALFFSGCNRTATRSEKSAATRDAATPPTSTSQRASTSNEAASTRDSSAPLADSSALVFIDVTKLARRHPAWILANELERSGLSVAPNANASTRGAREINVQRPLPPRRENGVAIPALPILRSVALPRSNAPSSSNDSFSADAASSADAARRASTRGGDLSFLPPPANASTPVYPASAATFSHDFGTLLDAMANRQSMALGRFFSVTQQRGAARRDQLRSDLLNALNDDIAADTEFQELQDTVPPTFLPPPATQLEMTNLRLQLVENTRTSQAEREAAAARLAALENAWRRRAGASLNAWLTARETVLTERPRQLKTTGTQRIAQTLGALQSDASTRRETSRDTQLELLARDFGAQPNFFTPDNFSSGSAAPVFSDFDFTTRPDNSGAQSQSAQTQNARTQSAKTQSAQTNNVARKKNNVRYETSRVLASSEKALRGVSALAQRRDFPDLSPSPRAVRVLAGSPQRRAQIVLLRARALRETLTWARLAAKRGGWRNVSYLSTASAAAPNGARDATAAAARILQLP